MARAHLHACRLVVIVICIVSVGVGCAGSETVEPSSSPPTIAGPASPSPNSTPRSAGSPSTAADYTAMKAQLTRRLRTGAAELRSVEALLVSVGGRTVLTYYHNREPTGYSHVWSVTKSLLSILIGVAV
jgi:hypothetical protein